MAKPFNELRERLLRAGVAPRHVRRYLRELDDHWADLRAEEERAGRSREEAESAAFLRLGAMDDLARAMIEQRQFQSWCARAPWAMFGIAPLSLLAAAWFVALFILWSGWQIFLPGAETPFGVRSGRMFEFMNLYFQAGRAIYFGAPLFIGWGIALAAARQRLNLLWPAAGMLLVALVGGTLQVHVTRRVASDVAGHVSMGIASGPTLQVISGGLVHALFFLSLTILPYLIWRLQKARSVAA